MFYAKILVKGKVQNVHYRDYVKEIARVLNINGVARHCYGDVEIEAEMEGEAQLNDFVRLIEKKKETQFGIDVSSVSVVSVTRAESPRFTKFSTE